MVTGPKHIHRPKAATAPKATPDPKSKAAHLVACASRRSCDWMKAGIDPSSAADHGVRRLVTAAFGCACVVQQGIRGCTDRENGTDSSNPGRNQPITISIEGTILSCCSYCGYCTCCSYCSYCSYCSCCSYCTCGEHLGPRELRPRHRQLAQERVHLWDVLDQACNSNTPSAMISYALG